MFVLLLVFASCDGGQDGDDPSGFPGPPSNPDPEPPGDFQAAMLELINGARSQGRNCGDEFYPAVSPVSWDERVEEAALSHSIDMVENQFFDHEGSDGSNAGDRLISAGYEPAAWGENILVGLSDGEAVIENWLESPGHCDIIMHPDLEDAGVGAAEGNYQGRSTFYWTLVLATESN